MDRLRGGVPDGRETMVKKNVDAPTDRSGQVWWFHDGSRDGEGNCLLYVIGPGSEDPEDPHGEYGHPCVDLFTGKLDHWYEDKTLWEKHGEFSRVEELENRS